MEESLTFSVRVLVAIAVLVEQLLQRVEIFQTQIL